MVAESTVIFAPMSQFGCVVAFARTHSGSSKHLRASSSADKSRKAPPDAVRITLRMPPGGTPWRAWKMALCSLSAGVMVTPYFSSKGKITGPPAMRVSLLAKAMRLPFLMASMVGSKPAHPTIPVTTTLASSSVATMFTPSAPPHTSTPVTPSARSLSFSSGTFAGSAHETTRTVSLNSAHCAARRSRFPPAESAVTLNLSGRARTMSNVCVPIDPVEPRREIDAWKSSNCIAWVDISFHAFSLSTGAAIGCRFGMTSVP
mmetsp:Transcript_72584/g.146089  ORF Transcript_72584/g.146089 Transcript_72584/m.146089 type:complete len:260 (+) Transcript_72584:814-1593(+)